MENLIDRFEAVSDDGQKYIVEHYQEVVPAGSYGDPRATIPGMSRYQTSSGECLNQIDSETFQIVIGKKIIRKVG